MELRKVKLPSGAELKIQLAPFEESDNLFRACLEEIKGLKVDESAEINVNFFKDVFCAGFSSKKVKTALDECMKRCLYDGERIDTAKTFESSKAREDYLTVCFEVMKENISPFTKNLYAQYATLSAMLQKANGPA